jgi:hypothetical protein
MVSMGSGEADLEIGVEETILIVLDGVRDRAVEDEASDLCVVTRKGGCRDGSDQSVTLER